MHGLKMRMPNLEIMVEIGNYLGFAVTPMSMTEVFSALEQGVIDGQENPPSTIRSQGWYEIQDYLLVSNHVFTCLFLCVNNDFYNSLDSDCRTFWTKSLMRPALKFGTRIQTQAQEEFGLCVQRRWH